MSLSQPEILTALKDLRDWGAESLILIPLFPQYSFTTSGSCLTATHAALKKLSWQVKAREVKSFPDHPGYIALLRKTVDEALSQARSEQVPGDRIHVLFSAHSLPTRTIERGDPYIEETRLTVSLATKDLETPWSLSFQSRTGPVSWVGPFTDHEIIRLAREGINRLVIVPVSFVSDHVETLYELDDLYTKLALFNGMSGVYRSRTFNGDQEFTKVLEDLMD